MEQLMVVPISKVQAIQRAGRAGRTREGKCVRLYAEKFYNEQMPTSTTPEIKRTNLTSMVLTLKSLGISDVLRFDYLDPPDPSQITYALTHLYFLGCLDHHGNLQPLGEELAKFPLEPAYGKSLLAGKYLGNSEDMLRLVAVMSSENMWINVSQRNEHDVKKLIDVKKQYMDDKSDQMLGVRVYD